MPSSGETLTDLSPFPQDLAQLPDGERIQEAFGWAPAAWGLVLFTFSLLLAFQPARLGTGERIGLGSALLGSLVLWSYEVLRRRQPKVLVRRGPTLALSLRGKLAREVGVAASGIYLRHPSRTWGPILMTTLGTLAAGSFLLPGGPATTWGDRITAALAALSFATLCTTLVRTRLFCEEALIPRDGGGLQHLLVRKRDLPRIFRPTS